MEAMDDYVPLIGFEDRYRIMKTFPYDIYDTQVKSMNYGVWSTRDGTILGLYDNEGQFKRVKKHQLIAQQFLPGWRKGCCVFHKNGLMNDNRLENLTYHRTETDKWKEYRNT